MDPTLKPLLSDKQINELSPENRETLCASALLHSEPILSKAKSYATHVALSKYAGGYADFLLHTGEKKIEALQQMRAAIRIVVNGEGRHTSDELVSNIMKTVEESLRAGLESLNIKPSRSLF